MQIKQADLFLGASHHFVREVMAIAEKQSYNADETVFHSGDPADFIFILITGQVRLAAGDSGRVVYTSSKTGELFGWSSLIGRPTYSASAHCEANTVLLQIDKKRLQKIIAREPAEGLLFFRQLAGALGDRLMEMYRIVDKMDSEAPRS